MSYMNPTPGVANQQIVLEIDLFGNSTVTSSAVTLGADKLVLPAIQKLTVNNSNGVFEWAQLDSRAKQVVATVSTNSIVTDVVVDQAAFFGNALAPATSISNLGIFAASSNKTKLAVKVRFSSPDGSGTGDTFSGVGYITNLAPTIAAEQPVWQTPLTVVISGDYVIKTNDTL